MSNLVSTKALKGHTDQVVSVCFSPDGQTLASGSQDKTVRLWNIKENKHSVLTGHGLTDWWSKVNSLAFSSTLQLLASGGDDKTIRLWSTETAEPLRVLTGHTQAVTTVAIHPQGKFLASGSRDKTIIVWSLETGEQLINLEPHTEILSVCFSPDGNWLASGGENGKVDLCNWDKNEVITLQPHSEWFAGVTSVAFHPQKRLIASGSKDKTIKISSVKETKELMTLSSHTSEVNSIAISPDGKILISGSKDKTLKLWNLNQGELIATIPHQGSVEEVAFSPNGKIVATACEDKVVRVYLNLLELISS